MQGPVVPYFDIEKIFEDADEYKKHRVQTLLAALDDIKKAYPKGKQIIFDASGFNISKDAWYLSTHVLVRGAGKYNSPKDVKAIVKTFRTPVFDDGVYAEGKSMRLPYCSKENDPKRILRRIEIENGKVIEIKLGDCENALGETYHDWLITNVAGERKVLAAEEEDKENPREDIAEKREQKFPPPESIAEIEQYIDMLSSKRAEAHNSRSYVIWALKDTSEETGFDLQPLAHKFAKTSADYEEGNVNTAYNKRKPAGEGVYKYCSIKFWAEEDSPDAYAAMQKKPDRSFLMDLHITRTSTNC